MPYRVNIDRATDTAIWNWSIQREACGIDAPNEDPVGVLEASIVGEAREITDQFIKGDPSWACMEDRAANRLGRNGGRTNPDSSCSTTCAPLRPNGLDTRY